MTKRRWSERDCRMKQKKRKFIQLSWSFEIQPLRRSCSSFQFAYDKVSVSSASSGPNTSENQSCHRVGKKVLQTFYYIHIYDIQRDLTQKITQNTQTNCWFYHVICAPGLKNRSKTGQESRLAPFLKGMPYIWWCHVNPHVQRVQDKYGKGEKGVLEVVLRHGFSLFFRILSA